MGRCRRCAPVPEQFRRTAELLERRWLISIVYAAASGATRFNEFRQALAGIPSRTLTDRLRELERAGLLERRVVPATPPYCEYLLTDRGLELAPLVEALARSVART